MEKSTSIIKSNNIIRKIVLIIFIIINLFLSVYGNKWGLPSRWHSDEKVADVLHMADEKKLTDPIGAFLLPTGYHIFLLTFFIPAYGYLKLINYPIADLKEAASISWFHMAKQFPDFAVGIYIYARTLSAILGALTVYLIYLLGKETYDEKTGLFSAASLSVCMGFIGVNHFAKYQSLVNLLIVLTVLFCLKALRGETTKSSHRYLLFGFFFAGFASSVHINAPFLLLPLFLTFIFIISDSVNKIKRFILQFISYIFLYIAGIVLGTPSLLSDFSSYFLKLGHKYNASIINKPATETTPFFVGPINYFFEILSIYGIPLFMLIAFGIFSRLFYWKKISKKEIVIFSFIFGYYFIMTILHVDKYPQTKHIIAIIPFLAIFAGKLMSEVFINRNFSRIGKCLFFSLIFLYSFAYSFKADLYFIKGDTRYESTQWIIKNIPKGSKIEVLDQLNYVASDDIMNDYEIIYFGRSSKDFKGKYFFKWNTVEDREEYLKYINKYDSRSDCILIDMPSDNLEKYLNPQGSHIPGRTEYIDSLFKNRKNFKVVKIIKPTNKMIESEKIKGLLYLQNFWWNPIPSFKDTAITIYIFKRIS